MESCQNNFQNLVNSLKTMQNNSDNEKFEDYVLLERDLVNISSKSIYIYQNKDILGNHLSFESDDSYKEKALLLIGCGKIRRLPIVLKIKNLNLKKFVCLSREKSWAAEYFEDWISAEHEDVQQIESIIIKIKEYMTKNQIKFDAIITYVDESVLLTSYLCEYFGLPGIPFNTCQKIKNKYEFRKMSKNLDISCPNFFLIESNNKKQYIEKISNHSGKLDLKFTNEIFSYDEKYSCKFPVIVKNALGVGKDFVKKCNNLNELSFAINESIEIKSNIDLVVEEFYDGHEIDCDILIQDNDIKFIVISDNFPPLEPYFFEQGGVTPSIELNKREIKEIETLIKKWLTQLNFKNACLHFEARCKPESIYKTSSFDQNDNLIDKNNFLMPIEINMRLAGAETWSMVKASCDVDLINEVVNIGLNKHLDKSKLSLKSRSAEFRCISKDFHPNRNVLLESICIDLQKIENQDDVVEISISRCIGEKLTKKDYVGWISVKANKAASYSSLIKKLDCSLDLIKIKYVEY